MKIKNLFACLILIMVACVLSANATAQETKTYQGSITIPGSTLSDGDQFAVQTAITATTGGIFSFPSSQTFVYDSNQDSYSYSLDVTSTNFFDETTFMGENILIGFSCFCDGKLIETFYNSNGAVAFPGFAEGVENFNDDPMSATITNLDFTALTGVPLSVDVVLPPSLVNPVGPMVLEVFVFDSTTGSTPGDPNGGGQSALTSPSVDLSNAVNGAVSLQVQVPELPAGAYYQVNYSCFVFDGCPAGLFETGFLNRNLGTQIEGFQAEQLTDISSTISMQALAGVSVSGDLSRGGAVDTVASFEAEVCALLNDGSNSGRCEQLIFAENETTKPFNFVMPQLSGGNGFLLRYDCSFFTCPQGAVGRAFFNGNASTPVNSVAAVTNPVSNAGAAGLQFSMLEAVTLDITLERPIGADTTDAVSVSFSIQDQQNFEASVFQQIDIPAGSAGSGVQTLSLPALTGSTYQVTYSCQSGCTGLVIDGTFTNGGFVPGDRFETISDLSVLGTNSLVLLEGIDITASVALPNLENAVNPVEIQFTLFDRDSQDVPQLANTTVFIDANTNAAPLNITVPASTGSVSLEYFCFSGCDGFVSTGFFDGFNLVPSFTTISDLTNLSGNQLVLPTAQQVIGSIVLPNSISASSPIELSIQVSDSNTAEFIDSDFLTIDTNESSVGFTLEVPSLTGSFSVQVDCNFGCDGLLPSARFNGLALTTDFVEVFDLSSLSVQPIELLEAVQITGTIRFPQAVTEPTDVQLSLSSNFGSFYTAFVTVPANADSELFSFTVSPTDLADDFRLSYDCFSCSSGTDFFDRGVFSIAGTTLDFNQATTGTLDIFEGVEFDVLGLSLVTFDLNLAGSSPLTSDVFPFLQAEVGDSFLNTPPVEFLANQNTTSTVTLRVPSGTESVKLAYFCFQCEGISSEGYFDGTSFTYLFDRQQDVLLANLDGQSLDLLAPFSLTGQIEIPTQIQRDGDLSVELILEDLDQGLFDTTTVVIGEMESSAEYSFPTAQRFGNYSFRYNCADCDGLLREGFYNGDEFISNQFNAFPFIDLARLFDESLALIPAVSVDGLLLVPSTTTSHPEYQVEVIATDLINFQSFTTVVTIPQDQPSAAYTLKIPDELANYRVQYRCLSCDGAFSEGFLTAQGTVLGLDDAELFVDLPLALQQGFEMLAAQTVNGSLQRPAGSDDQQLIEVSVDITVVDDNGDFVSFVGSEFISLGAGELSASLNFDLPNIPDSQFEVSYSCVSCPPEVFASGSFTTSGTTLGDLAGVVLLDQLAASFEFELLPALELSGELVLPPSLTIGGDTAAFIAANIKGPNDEFVSSEFSFAIISDDPLELGRAPFNIQVPVIENTTVTLEYSCTDCSEFITPLAFLGDLDTTPREAEARQIAIAELPLQGIEFTMLEAATISGSVSRPAGASTVEPLFIQIAARENQDSSGFDRSIFIEIPVDETSVDYVIPVPRETDVFINYFCFGCTDIWRVGYYSEDGTEPVIGRTDFINSGTDGLVDIDLELVQALRLEGELSRHSQDTNSAEVLPNVIVNVTDDAGEIDADFKVTGYGQQLFIGENGSSTFFSIEVPDINGGGYLLRYECPAGCGEDTFSAGFYAAQNTNAVFEFSDGVPVTRADDLAALNFSMLPGRTILGDLSRPAGADDSQELGLLVAARSQAEPAGQLFEFATFAPSNIPELVSTIPYSITLPAVNERSYRLDYECIDCADIFPFGYYSSTGTQFAIVDAEQIDDVGASLVGADIPLLASQVVGGDVSRSADDDGSEALAVALTITAVNEIGEAVGQVFPLDPFDPANTQRGLNVVALPELINTSAYSVTIPAVVAEDGFVVDYQCDGCANNIDNGFFAASGTVALLEQADVVTAGTADILSLNLAMLADGDDDEVATPDDNCALIANADQVNFDGDDFGDVCDTDIDNDGAANDVDSDDMNVLICSDADLDQCNDCSSGMFDVNDDGLDTDGNGMCDLGDPDDDGDLTLDAADCAPLDVNLFQNLAGFVDTDEDGVGTGELIDICSGAALPVGFTDVATDDNCPAVPNSDQANLDGDEFGDLCDADTDGDGIDDGQDNDPLNARICGDSDDDQCDDCRSGSSDPMNDGTDSDRDGICNIGDDDDDNDTVLDDEPDNCPVNANMDQADSDGNGIGDVCDGLCIPIKVGEGKFSVLCL